MGVARRTKVLLISANREKLPSPVVPLGVLSVAGALRVRQDVSVCDLCFAEDPMAAVNQAILDFRPDVVGLGIRNLHTNAYDDSEPLIAYYAALVRAIREACTVPLVLGGGGFSLQPRRLLERLGADYGVVGEGEQVFVELVESLARGERPPAIVSAASVAPRVLGPTRLVRGPAPPDDLDAWPRPARDLVDPRYYQADGTDNIQTKRGCAFQCTYCDYPDIEGKLVRVRDPDAVADEVVERSRVPGVTHVFFVDSVFNVPPAHALAVCRALTARGAPLPWVCYGTPIAFDDALCAAMVEARCVGVEIGSDSGTDAMLRRLKKPFRREHIVETRRLFLEHGLLDSHTFVLGAEEETVEEARATLAFVEELDPDVAVFIVFMEDREERRTHRALHRQALLQLLSEEAPKHSAWIVPELGIRLGENLSGRRFDGPPWLTLARMQRRRKLAGSRRRPHTVLE